MKWTFGQKLGRPECPYLQRWIADFGHFSIRLHRWLGSDDQRHHHDHPWWFVTLILKGGYVDVSPAGRRDMSAGTIAFREAEYRHTTEVKPGGCWSLLVTGPEERPWGFWVGGRFRKRNKYFFEHGHHPCDPGDA